MESLKGVGRMLIYSTRGGRHRVDLVGFVDGSMSIRVDAETFGICEPFEIDDAIRAYGARVGINRAMPRDELNAVIFMRADSGAASPN